MTSLLQRPLIRLILIAPPTALSLKLLSNRCYAVEKHHDNIDISPKTTWLPEALQSPYEKYEKYSDKLKEYIHVSHPKKWHFEETPLISRASRCQFSEIEMHTSHDPDRKRDFRFHSSRIFDISGKLWSIETDSNKIHISTKTGDDILTIAFAETGNCNSVARIESQVIIAGTRGLFAWRENNDVTQLLAGNFSDLSIMGNLLFALDWEHGRLCEIKVNQDGGISGDVTIHPLPFYVPNKDNTIQATTEFLYVAQWEDDSILQLNHDGTLAGFYGGSGEDRDHLQGPRICGVDPEGSVLIADQVNCCLKTLDKNGVWNCVKMVTELPCDAIVTEEGKLIIKSADKMQIFELKTQNGLEGSEKDK